MVVVSHIVSCAASRTSPRWAIAGPAGCPIRRVEDVAGTTPATDLVHSTSRCLRERGLDVAVQVSWGATEAKAAEGLVDAIVEVTETGSTIRAHGLRIVADLFESNPQLIVNPSAWEDPWKRRKVEQISLLLQGALRAQTKVGLKLNVASENLDRVIELIPSLTAPTVAPLHASATLRGKRWLSVESVIEETVARDLIPRLREAGAVGIIEYPLNKVV